MLIEIIIRKYLHDLGIVKKIFNIRDWNLKFISVHIWPQFWTRSWIFFVYASAEWSSMCFPK